MTCAVCPKCVILAVEKCIHPPTALSGGFLRVGGQLMADALTTVEAIDALIRALWHQLGSNTKATRDAATIRIDRLLEARYALTNGATVGAASPSRETEV